MGKEEWKEITIIDNEYQISNMGRVINKKGQIMKTHIDKDGYQRIALYDRTLKKYKHLKVARLVAIHFIPNPDNLPEVNHIDEIKHNDIYTNLEWCSNYYNQNYGNHQKNSAKTRTNHPKFSKAVDVFDLDGKFIETLPSSRECGRKYGIPSSNVRICCDGGHWSDKTHTTWWKVNKIKNNVFKWHKNEN